MHMLPRVRELHQRFPDVLTVIGVHAGKFATERHTERIAEACDRLDVRHAVVNDRQFRIWRQYAIQAWPTLALIDAEGHLFTVQAGETSTEAWAEIISEAAAHGEAHGVLLRAADPVTASLSVRADGALRYPGRVLVAGERLLVSDTGHGRVLEASLNATRTHASVTDEHSGFAEPLGIAVVGQTTYVADRRDHSVWAIDSAGRRRVAGIGRIGSSRLSGGTASTTGLRSPWGLASRNGRMVVAMAGAHQIWEIDPLGDELRLLAGTGWEELTDGPADQALLAQPSGVAVAADGSVGFADSESSAIRLLTNEGVRTVVGTGLFDFGDRDGRADEVLLQHAQDVTWHNGHLVCVDTYNDRLKAIDPATRTARALPGEAGGADALREPGGVSSDGNDLWVADTGRHRVVRIAPHGSVHEIELA